MKVKMMSDPLAVDPSEFFPHLSRAPVVEAVIDFRARATAEWEEQTVGIQLKEALPDYPTAKFHHGLPDKVADESHEQTEVRSPTWVLQCESKTKPQIAVFSHDGFFLSRLKPYENWVQLSQEAMRLWKIFRQYARPSEVQKISVRFINRIELPPYPLNIAKFIQPVPQLPQNLPDNFISGGFFHQDYILVREQPHYLMTLLKTIPPGPPGQRPSLILDIDVSKMESTSLDENLLIEHLEEMRWLKNKLFFGSITKTVQESHQ